MKVLLFAIIAVLLYNSPDARNATSDILRKTANVIESSEVQPDNYTFTIPNPFSQ